MKKIGIAFALLALVASAGAAPAQICNESATVGNFLVAYDGAAYDGVDTEFSYCITGLGGDEFKALSHWDLALGQCLGADDITDCSTGDCYYQIDDPKLGITGIKFDEEEVEAGETKCYSFSLLGDWSGSVGNTTVGIKAGQNLDYGEVCGPVCVACKAGLSVKLDAAGTPRIDTRILHQRAIPVTSEIFYRLVDAAGNRLRSWTDGPYTFEFGKTVETSGTIPGVTQLAPGTYTVFFRLRGMNGWVERSASFVVPAE